MGGTMGYHAFWGSPISDIGPRSKALKKTHPDLRGEFLGDKVQGPVLTAHGDERHETMDLTI